jgi:hypothetical protein
MSTSPNVYKRILAHRLDLSTKIVRTLLSIPTFTPSLPKPGMMLAIIGVVGKPAQMIFPIPSCLVALLASLDGVHSGAPVDVDIRYYRQQASVNQNSHRSMISTD